MPLERAMQPTACQWPQMGGLKMTTNHSERNTMTTLPVAAGLTRLFEDDGEEDGEQSGIGHRSLQHEGESSSAAAVVPDSSRAGCGVAVHGSQPASRNRDGQGSGLEGDLEQIARIEPEDRTAVRLEIADRRQLRDEALRGLEGRQEDEVVVLPDPAVALVDVAVRVARPKRGKDIAQLAPAAGSVRPSSGTP